MDEFKYGDLVCYRTAFVHDEPMMYVGPCGHRDLIALHSVRFPTLIDIIDVSARWAREIDCKDPAMWQLCDHRAGVVRVMRSTRDE